MSGPGAGILTLKKPKAPAQRHRYGGFHHNADAQTAFCAQRRSKSRTSRMHERSYTATTRSTSTPITTAQAARRVSHDDEQTAHVVRCRRTG